MCRVNAETRICLVKATLRRPQPANPQARNDFYECPVHFAAAENSFTLSAADVDRVLPTTNRPLAGVLDGMLTEQPAKLSKDDVVSHCKAEFLEQLSSGEPSAEDIAQRLHMSSRTLQRKLSAASTNIQKLADECRRDLALRYINDAGCSITDITFLLGFSGQSTFSRAAPPPGPASTLPNTASPSPARHNISPAKSRHHPALHSEWRLGLNPWRRRSSQRSHRLQFCVCRKQRPIGRQKRG